MAYAATFDIEPPDEFDKAQVGLRIVIVIVIGWLFDGILGAAFWLLPVIAAILIAQKGGETYLDDAESGPTRWLRYIMGFFSYIALARDELPLDDPDSVGLMITPTGSPTVGSALFRIILVIPHAIVLAIVGIAFAVVWLIAVISILINGVYPDWAFNFIRGYLCWNARVLAYSASLVDEYPPFSFSDDGALTTEPPASSEARAVEPHAPDES